MRPRLAPEERRHVRVNVYLTPEEHQALTKEKYAQGKSVSRILSDLWRERCSEKPSNS